MFTRSESCNFSRQSLAQAVALGAMWMAGTTLITSPVQAQEGARRSSATLLEEVLVLARKRSENSQDVPIALNAFSGDQLIALKVRDLTSLAVGMPNVALDEVGTTRGTASFAIRGLGITSSIVSIDPAVGVFIDGVFLGINNGIIYDTFDLESIEVLRGPQGILFGRNVSGGAVLMNTKKPSENFEASVRTTYEVTEEGGDNRYIMASVGGPVSETFSAKLAAFFNDDEGGLTNDFDGKDHGAVEQTMIRPVVVWTPTEDLELILRYEYIDTDGDGPSGQSHTNFNGVDGNPVNHDRDGFSFSINERGEQTTEAHRFTFETNWNVGENGTVTNIFGWRDFEAFDLLDVDAQPVSNFHATNDTTAEQYSNELRYNTLIDSRANVTMGVYYFKNDIELHDSREILGGRVTQDGGGEYEVETKAIFGAVDYELNEQWSLNAGLRYTEEEKAVKVATFNRNQPPCNVLDGTCVLDFIDDDDWNSWSPKLGATYTVSDEAIIYAHWTRGFRSGGYNLRNSSSDAENNGPGPFDQEEVNNYEAGFKMDFPRGRLNGAVFFLQGKDMQRAVLQPDPGAASGNATVIKNAGDADHYGMELDGIFRVSDSLLLSANVGYLNAEYTSVTFDINADGVIDGADKDLDIPRAAELTYSVGLNHDLELGRWLMSSRVSLSHRDESFASDNNESTVPEQDIVDAGIDFFSEDGHWSVGIYGKNLTNEVKWGLDTNLPTSLGGGTLAPLSKGRRYGVELTYNF